MSIRLFFGLKGRFYQPGPEARVCGRPSPLRPCKGRSICESRRMNGPFRATNDRLPQYPGLRPGLEESALQAEEVCLASEARPTNGGTGVPPVHESSRACPLAEARPTNGGTGVPPVRESSRACPLPEARPTNGGTGVPPVHESSRACPLPEARR
jgi:hypothetical protein